MSSALNNYSLFTDYRYFATGTIQLPTYKGYTIDTHLREFRTAVPGEVFDVIPFDCVEGNRMVTELLELLPQENALFDELMAAIDIFF